MVEQAQPVALKGEPKPSSPVELPPSKQSAKANPNSRDYTESPSRSASQLRGSDEGTAGSADVPAETACSTQHNLNTTAHTDAEDHVILDASKAVLHRGTV